MQTASCAIHLKQMGHDIAVFAFYGLRGSKLEWGDIPIYPNNPGDWGLTNGYIFYQDWKADILITLVDVWVLNGIDPRMNWIPWTPIDHQPIPAFILNVLKTSPGLIKPIAMSKYGQTELKKNGIESYYIPHTVDTHLYAPNAKAREECRKAYGWEDKFVIGTIGTNTAERKNWTASLKAIKLFASKHNDVIYYMHTNRLESNGINLEQLRCNLGLEKITFFPHSSQLEIGIDRETLIRTYNVFDVFLLPSKGEGFGIPIIEAQSCGIPVIICNNTAQPELLGGGWLIKEQIPEWTQQGAWQFNCHPEEIAEHLESAYQAKKNGLIEEIKHKARQKAFEYDEAKVFTEYWGPILTDVEERIKQPKNLEGVQQWRLLLIPSSCSPQKVLDIGCGITQPYREHLEKLGEYIGIDIKEGPNVTTMDAHQLPYKNREFGFVWLSEVLEHIDNPKQVLDEARRVGVHGCCIFSTPANPYFKMDPSHQKIKNIRYTTLRSGDGLICW